MLWHCSYSAARNREGMAGSPLACGRLQLAAKGGSVASVAHKDMPQHTSHHLGQRVNSPVTPERRLCSPLEAWALEGSECLAKTPREPRDVPAVGIGGYHTDAFS